MEPTALILYSYWRSSCSYRVRIALHLKNLSYATRATHLLKDGGQQNSKEYEAINPMKSVPALVVTLPSTPQQTVTLTQSPAILEFLEEAFPDRRRLLPADALLRHRVREICSIIVCDIQPVQNLKVLKHAVSLLPSDSTQAEKDSTRTEWAQRYITSGLHGLETLMARYAGQYSVGDDITLADVALVPQIYNANRFKIDLTPYPTILRVYNSCIEIEAFKTAHPSAQPDAEVE
jgi:maleylacetoacetate isomerase